MPRPSGECVNPARTIAPAGAEVISSPQKKIRPVRDGMIPEIDRSVVVFPAPLAPRSVRNSPSAHCSSIPCRTGDSPKDPPTFSSRSMMGPQIRFYHRLVASDLLRTALRDLRARRDDHDPLARAHDHAHVMLDKHDRHSLRLQTLQDLDERLGLAWIEPRRGLVDQQETRGGTQGER